MHWQPFAIAARIQSSCARPGAFFLALAAAAAQVIASSLLTPCAPKHGEPEIKQRQLPLEALRHEVGDKKR